MKAFRPDRMSRRQLTKLGFRPFDEGGLMLIPDAIYDEVADGTMLAGISGEEFQKGQRRVDRDTRFGLLAYGVFPQEKFKSASAKKRTKKRGR